MAPPALFGLVDSQSIFANNSGARITGGTFINAGESASVNVVQRLSGYGFERLERVVLHEAMRDSSARETPRCFEDTRAEHRRNITSWGGGEWKSRNARVMWMDGPAGVGKSAVAQTWSEELEEKFSAGFFFSQVNGWNQPIKLIPTLSYQLATRYDSYRAAIEAVIACDPLVLEMSLEAQFRELLVKPLRKLSPDDRSAIVDTIVIVDGLDECGPINAKLDHVLAQETIIKLITTAAASRDSPFLWGVVSRPERHIVSAFASKQAHAVTWRLVLPLRAPNVDEDITLYLRDAFATVRLKYPSIRSPWPSEDSLTQLVKLSDGLFIYAASAARYIERGSGLPSGSRLGPEERLQLLLEPSFPLRANFSKLDQLYLLIMDQIPKAILPYTLGILRITQWSFHLPLWISIPVLSSLFGMSNPAVYDAVSPLYSVLQVTTANRQSYPLIKFYHASFGQFLRTQERSTNEYCIIPPRSAVSCIRRVLMCSLVCHPVFHILRADTVSGNLCTSINCDTDLLAAELHVTLEECDSPQDEAVAVGQLAMFFIFLLPWFCYPTPHFQPHILEKLAGLDWNVHAIAYRVHIDCINIPSFISKIPKHLRSEIINPHNKIVKAVRVLLKVPTEHNYIVGKGAKRAPLRYSKSSTVTTVGGSFILEPYPITSRWRRIALYLT